MCGLKCCPYEDDITITCDDCQFFAPWPMYEADYDEIDVFDKFDDFEDFDDL